METLVVEVKSEVIAALQQRARAHGVSVEEEHRRILHEVLGSAIRSRKRPRPSFKEHLLRMPDVGDDSMFDRHAGDR